MTLEEIVEKASAAYDFDNIRVDSGSVWFSVSFDYDPETDEPHDVARDVRIEIYDTMRSLGLEAKADSDHDTVWGTISEVGP